MAAFNSKDQKIAQTSSNEVFFANEHDYNNWKNDVTDYVVKKTEFQGKPEPYRKVTQAGYKALETQYNPVT